ncbi:MAG TPA: sensor histidine kinase, partial [Puia sp.]|nr:sensor histidine kinase [Puia sp.]
LKAKWLIGAWYAFQPADSSYRKAVEFLIQAKEEAGHAGDIEMEAQSYCLLGKAYHLLGDTTNGNRCYFAVINNHAFSRLTSLQAKVRKYMGIYGPFIVQTMKLRMDCLTAAYHQYQLLGDTGNQVNALMDIAYQRFAGGDAKGSQEAALQSLSLQKAWSFPNSQYTYDLLAYLRVFLGDQAGALQYAISAVDAVEKSNSKFFEPHAYYRVAGVYVNLDDKAAATEWFKRALHAGLERNDRGVIYLALENAAAGRLNLDLGRPVLNTLQEFLRKDPPSNLREMQLANRVLGDCYIQLRDYLTARRYYLAALTLDEKLSATKGGMKNAYLMERVARINIQLREYATSRKYLITLLSPVYAKLISKPELYSVYEDLCKVDSALSDYPSAYHYLSLAERLSDEIYSEAQTKQILDLNVKYQTLQREKLLQISEAKRQLEAQKDADTRKLFYAGFALLGILITMGSIRYYNNKRKNRQLREQKKEIDAQNEVLHELNDRQTVLLEEKEWLLREIHHRVKNNLQIIASLLSAQSEFLDDQTALKVMTDSQNRVKAMSIIHQKLYNSQNLSSIDMAEYIGDLVGYLRDGYDGQRRVIFNLEIAKIRLDVSKAVPLGLILNEAITNAFKYAFDAGDDARISIRLMMAENLITLELTDNGRGLAEGFSVSQNDSFGMILMKGMAEDLEGNFMIRSEEGTTITVSFMNSTGYL